MVVSYVKKGESMLQKIVCRTLFYSLCMIISCNLIASPGSLDTSFNHNGSATSFVSATINQAQAVAVQTNGKIITAGYAGDNACIEQFNNDGTLDVTFNANNLVKPGTISVTLGMQSAAYNLVLQPDGKIIIVGLDCMQLIAFLR